MFESKFGEQSFGGDYRLRVKFHLRNRSRRDNTVQGSAKESTSASASAKRDAEPRSRGYPGG